MRDRLIELIQKAKIKEQSDLWFGDIDTAIDMPDHEEYLANYLIKHGVIVPPCKVGDTVWLIYTDTNWRLEIVGHHILRGKVNAIEINESDGICFQTQCSTFFPENIGKTVFFTKEEAEQALKEREGK